MSAKFRKEPSEDCGLVISWIVLLMTTFIQQKCQTTLKAKTDEKTDIYINYAHTHKIVNMQYQLLYAMV